MEVIEPEEGCRDCICCIALVDVVLQHQPLVEGGRQQRVVPGSWTLGHQHRDLVVTCH